MPQNNQIDISDLLAKYGAPASNGNAKKSGIDAAFPIAPEDQAPVDPTWLGKTLNGLDYLGNISRSAIKGAMDETTPTGSSLVYALQAAQNKRRTDETSLKDLLTKKLGLGKVRAGKDDGKFQWGDIADVATDAGLSIATDPLTYLTMGLSGAAKGALGQGIKSAALAAKAGEKTGDAAKYIKALNAGKMGLGAAYGLGTGDANDSAGEMLTRAALGAGAVGAGIKWGPSAMKALGKGADGVTDAWMVMKHGDDGKGFSAAWKSARESRSKIAKIAADMGYERGKILEGLSPEERLAAVNKMGELKTEELRRGYDELANQFGITDEMVMAKMEEAAPKKLEALLEKGAHGEQVDTSTIKSATDWNDANFGKVKRGMVDDAMEKLKAGDADDKALHAMAFNQARENAAASMDDFASKTLAGETDKVKTAIDDLSKFNQDIVKRINTEAKGIKGGVWNKDTGEGIVGLKYHTPDVYELKDIGAEAERFFGKTKDFRMFAAKSLQRSDAANEIAGKLANGADVTADHLNKANDLLYNVYANDFAKHFLDKSEQAAVKLVANLKPNSPNAFLQGFDRLNNFSKSMMLHASTSWLKNNYIDNVAKAFVETGMGGALDVAAAPFKAFKQGFERDLVKFYRGDLPKIDTAKMKELLDTGVIEGTQFAAENEDILKNFAHAPSKLAKQDEAAKSWIAKAAQAVGGGMDKTQEFFANTVGATGSMIESTARANTYFRFKDMLRDAPQFKGMAAEEAEAAIRKQAAEMVGKTFYNYGDVNFLEAKVAKRIVPFYAFYSKNLPYWAETMVNPEKVGRIAQIEHTRRNIGRDPTAKEREGFQDYIAGNAPRIMGKDNKGNLQIGIVPSMSQYDAIKMLNPFEWGGQIKEKMNPLAKLPVELLSGKDLFTGDGLKPSDTDSGKKFLFSRGYQQVAAKKTLEGLGMDPQGLLAKATGLDGVQLDKHGNPYTTSDATVVWDRILSTLVPHGIVDQTAGTIGKIATGKENPGEALWNRFGAMPVVEVSPVQLRMVRAEKEAARKRALKLEREKLKGI